LLEVRVRCEARELSNISILGFSYADRSPSVSSQP
jgi:hypothetical protein